MMLIMNGELNRQRELLDAQPLEIQLEPERDSLCESDPTSDCATDCGKGEDDCAASCSASCASCGKDD